MENNQELTVKSIAELINNKELWSTESPTAKYKGLGRLLRYINWSAIEPETIIPKIEMRKFITSIQDEEVRLSVCEFLLKFANDYFIDSAIVLNSNYSNSYQAALDDIEILKSEIDFQIKLIRSTNDYSGEEFSGLKRRLEEQKEQVKKLNQENVELRKELNSYKHPYDNGYCIPHELLDSIFRYSMEYLAKKELVLPIQDVHPKYGIYTIACYQWLGGKALFGYFVERMNKELELQEARMPLNWKVFKPAIINYDDLIKEARKAVSNYTKNKSLMPAKADIIEEAIKYAEDKKANDPF